MKAKHFTKIRKQVKWYNVSYREHILDYFRDKKQYWLNRQKMLVSDTINVQVAL